MMDKYFFVVFIFICVTVVNAGQQCTYYDDSFYCPTTCCGDRCCGSEYMYLVSKINMDHIVGVILGLVFGILGFIGIIVTVVFVLCCCCRKSRGQTGQVCHPTSVTSTVPMYGVQTTIVPGPSQIGYTNAAPNMPGLVDNAPKWQEPPPSYTTVTTG